MAVSENTKNNGDELIKKELNKLAKAEIKDIVIGNLEKISNGERDFKF